MEAVPPAVLESLYNGMTGLELSLVEVEEEPEVRGHGVSHPQLRSCAAHIPVTCNNIK